MEFKKQILVFLRNERENDKKIIIEVKMVITLRVAMAT